MKKETQIYIYVGVAIAVIALTYFFVKKTRNANRNSFVGQTGASPVIPEAVQRELPYWENGDGFTHSGVKYIKVNGAWQVSV